jgi:hypothetical protein
MIETAAIGWLACGWIGFLMAIIRRPADRDYIDWQCIAIALSLGLIAIALEIYEIHHDKKAFRQRKRHREMPSMR